LILIIDDLLLPFYPPLLLPSLSPKKKFKKKIKNLPNTCH